MATKIYEPKKVVCSIGGELMSGFASGSFIKVEGKADGVSMEEAGADGIGSFVVSGNHQYDVTLVLQTSSSSNAVLQRIHDKTLNDAPELVEVKIECSSSGSKFFAEECMILKAPPIDRMHDKLGTNEWKLGALDGRITHA